jgi:hypothetical protein
MTTDYFIGLLVALSLAVVFVPLGVAMHHEEVAKRDRQRHPAATADLATARKRESATAA